MFIRLSFCGIVETSSRQNIDPIAALINAFIESDDEPFYDKVASDEDDHSLNNNNKQQKRTKVNPKSKKVEIIIKNHLSKFLSIEILVKKRTTR